MKFSRRQPDPAPSATEESAAASAGPAAPAAPAQRLVEAGIVDRDFCSAQAGVAFDSDLAAARACVSAAGAWSPHPLLDLGSLPPWLRAKLEEGAFVPLLRYLTRAGSRDRLSPLFDASSVAGTDEQKAAHPGGALGLFLSTAGPGTELPGGRGLTWGVARGLLLEHARLVRAQQELRGPRTTETWDADAEGAWRARWQDAPLPDGDGPLVSVVMPVRNRAGVVEVALASLAAQTLQRWELVVVDDGSTDDTVAVLETWAARDPRIRVVQQEWGGVCAARNTALAAARSPYVAFLDSDNTWRPDFLRLAVGAMHGHGLRAAYAGMVLRDSDDPERVVHRAFRGSRDALMVVNHVDLNVLVVERDLALEVGGFDVALRRWVDHDFALKLAGQVELELLPFLAVDYDDSHEVSDRITTSESDAWQYVVLGQHWVDWTATERDVPARVAGRVSVVIPTWNDSAMTLRAVETVLRNTPGVDVEVVVVDNGSRSDVAMTLGAGLLGDPRLRLVRLPRNLNFAIGCNVGFARSTGEHVLFLNNDTEPRPGWWEPLVAHLADERVLGVQPLLLYPDDTIQTAGTVFPVDHAIPCHYLVGHPMEDAAKISDPRFTAVTAAALLMRASDVARLRGFDTIFVNGAEDVDLCLRAGELREGHFVVETASRVTHHEGKTAGRMTQVMENRVHLLGRWRGRLPLADRQRWTEAGFAIAHVGGEDVALPRPKPLIVRPPAPPLPDGSPALRWALKIAAPGGEKGDLWGDVHFARSMARALSARGQDPVLFRHGAHHVAATRMDDVVLGIRGLDPIRPIPGKVNAVWVISHPDDVSAEELLDFELVYAASASWAALMSERTGRAVQPLLQATDLALRPAASVPLGDGSRPLFVGNTHARRPRQIVLDAVATGVPVEVHGPGWDGVLPDGHLRSSYVANDALLTLYRTHGLVLADHWGDMATHGFLANRLFDAVAAGARVVCDDVPGVEELEGAVQVYRTPEELAFLCSAEGRSRWPSDDAMAAISDRVAAAHSFDARAAQVLSDASAIWTSRQA